jgi:hypothetical protein
MGVVAKMEYPVLYKTEQDATHNIDRDCLCSSMHRLSEPDDRAISKYVHDPTILN